MLVEEGDDKLVHLIRKLLLHKVCALWQVCNFQIRHIFFDLPTCYELFHPWKFVDIVLLTHNQQCRYFHKKVRHSIAFQPRPVHINVRFQLIQKY